MGLNIEHLRAQVVRPALDRVGLWSKAAENLVLATAVQESRLHYLVQLGEGPALGLFQVEPQTHYDLWENYLRYRKARAKALYMAAGMVEEDPHIPPHDWLVYNLRYAAAVCRLIYRRAPDRLPEADDVAAMAALWKKRYNTEKGRGTEEEFSRAYREVISD